MKKKILIVDDESDLRELLRWFFNSKDFEVIEARDGKECLEKIKTDRPDLIILDVMMPGMDGWEVSRKIKEEASTQAIPVSILSVLSDPEAMKKSRDYAHADMHLSKPIDFYMLNKTIRSLIS